MEPGEIEFIAPPSSVSGDEDVLDIGRQRRGIPRWLQAVFALAILISAVFTVAHDSGTKKSVTEPTVPPAGSLLADGPSQTPELPILTVQLPHACARSGCVVSPGVPYTIIAAVHDYVPDAALPTVTTIETVPAEGDKVIQERTIESVFGSVDLLVRITPYRHPSSSAPSPIKATPPGLASAFLSVEGAAYVVDLEWIGPETQPPPIDALNMLIRDSRLEVAG